MGQSTLTLTNWRYCTVLDFWKKWVISNWVYFWVSKKKPGLSTACRNKINGRSLLPSIYQSPLLSVCRCVVFLSSVISVWLSTTSVSIQWLSCDALKMLLTAVVLLSAVLGLAYLYLQKCWSFWKGQGLPQIDPKSILGSMPFFITKSCPLDEGLIQACFLLVSLQKHHSVP